MRFSLIDLFFAIVCVAVGTVLGDYFTSGFPYALRITAFFISGPALYLVLVYPVYRGFRLFPLILPLCPGCRRREGGYRILGGDWPRISFQCPLCNEIFVVWMNGTPGELETWDKPVLALKWPYAWGWYQRMTKPGTNDEPKSDTST